MEHQKDKFSLEEILDSNPESNKSTTIGSPSPSLSTEGEDLSIGFEFSDFKVLPELIVKTPSLSNVDTIVLEIDKEVKKSAPPIENTLIDPNFMNLLFNSDEEVSVSDNKYATQSICIAELSKPAVTLISNSDKVSPRTAKIEDLTLMSLNPIKGKRNDKNCTSFRTFLVEIDTMPLNEQMKYVNDTIKLPYSACVFSGGKSLHFAIVLEEGFLSLSTYNYHARWILNIAKEADQNTINPSRCIRVPNANRILDDGTISKQKLVALKKRISLEELNVWLSKHENCRPKKATKKLDLTGGVKNINWVPKKTLQKVQDGINSSTSNQRNKDWFVVACSMAKYNFEYEDIIDYFDSYFEEESDFKRAEWERTIRSACDKVKSEKEES